MQGVSAVCILEIAMPHTQHGAIALCCAVLGLLHFVNVPNTG